MMIDAYVPSLLAELPRRAAQAMPGQQLYLLIDGVFLPGFHRRIGAVVPHNALALLFDVLPGSTEQVLAVSPFLVRYSADLPRLHVLLEQCSGWPMLSVIQTTETLHQLKTRLAVWCVIQADGQRFNFRFPDTRRLPGIFQALSEEQRAQMAGPATRWSYVDRSGQWQELAVTGKALAAPGDKPELAMQQFGAMVSDSEPDEMLLRLSDRGRNWEFSLSQQHAVVLQALAIADSAGLETDLRLEWCEACLDDASQAAHQLSGERLARWREALVLT